MDIKLAEKLHAMAGNLWSIYRLMNQSFEVYKSVWLTVDGAQLTNKRYAVSSLH
jgi:hypothetical protein